MIPLPDDLAIRPAAGGSMPRQRLFLGAWGGDAWGDILPTMLVVEDIGRDDSATVVYAIGESPWVPGPPLRPAVIFECIGVPGVIEQIMVGAPSGARIVVVGVCMQRDSFEPMFGINKELNVQFVLGYNGEEFAATLRHIAEGELPVAPLITGTVGVEGVADAFAALASPDTHAKILVEPWHA